MEHGDDELHFLLHAFGEFFEFFVPPGHDAKFVEPHLEAVFCLCTAEAFELCEIDGLLADFHFFVESALFGKIADAHHVLRSELVTVKGHFSAVGCGDAVDDSDEGGFSCAVGTEESEDFAARHVDADVVKGGVGGIALHNVGGGEKIVVHYGGFRRLCSNRLWNKECSSESAYVFNLIFRTPLFTDCFRLR